VQAKRRPCVDVDGSHDLAVKAADDRYRRHLRRENRLQTYSFDLFGCVVALELGGSGASRGVQ
jgi:hypothetical protein